MKQNKTSMYDLDINQVGNRNTGCAIFLVILLLILSLTAYPQKKQRSDSSAKLPSQVDSSRVPKYYSLMMPVEDWNGLLEILKTADRSQQTINLWLRTIVSGLKPIKDEKKD